MQENNAKKPAYGEIRHNTRFVAILLALATLAVTFRLVNIQVVNSEDYKRLATKSQWEESVISPIRGTILDANGNVLAQSAKVWKLYLIPEQFGDEGFRNQVCRDVADRLELDADEMLEKTIPNEADENGHVIDRKIYVADKLELPQKQLIYCGKSGSNRAENDDCLYHKKYTDSKGKLHRYSTIMGFDEDMKRYYPMGEFASSIVGFIDADGNGTSGIERYYNTDLSGVAGKVTSYGTNVDTDNTKTYDAKDGTSLVLTIDETIQYNLDQNLKDIYVSSGGLGAYGIVMSVKTGAILAMDSVGYKGSYDLSNPYEINSYYRNKLERAVENDNFDYLDEYCEGNAENQEKLEEIRQTPSFEERKNLHSGMLKNFFMLEQWNNYIVSETYHPGSVFKIFVAAAAIEENVLGDDFTYSCYGSKVVDDRTFNCHLSAGHGTQDLRHGLMNSCNPFFITVGLKLGAEKFSEYFKAFGFAEKTGLEASGEANSIYVAEDKLTKVSLASESFGQTFSITPIQLITAISCIANGGNLMQPYLVEKEIDADGNVVNQTVPTVKRQVISKETAAEVASMMEDVCISGTGKNGYVAGYRVAGKTGTTQKYQLRGTYIASFGCFAPADNPEIAVLIIVDEPQSEMNGSIVCAPVAAKVVESSLEYLGIERQYTEDELEDLDTTTPGVIGKNADEAREILKEAGFTVKLIGDGDVIKSQSPAGGQTIPQDGVVAIYATDDEEEKITVEVPDFSNLSINETKRYAKSEGVNIRISGNSGSGVVSYDQSIAPGETVEYGTVVTVYFKSYENVGDTT
ncbi:MAG: PASTA domain-containing protein [Clostridia bacterium]|nr:PASTA domain-containing protein [Clostridia bacterium]